jgi:tyrosyl-tRNA synthetase
MNFVEELRWRGMIQDIMPGTEDQLNSELTVAYLGIDPTADSLHIGHLVGVMMLKHFQVSGHKPIALIGGATGMIGDPSGKSQERNLMDEKTLRHNQECLKLQLKKFLDFDSGRSNSAEMVNNYDWMKDYTFLGFIRDIGKHITVNYMMAKDSVKKRISSDARSGMSFTEFTYQLVQGYDFLYLFREKNCRLQMGGADQWGNIVTGTELIRRIEGGDAYAITCPLITKSDGGKFGKTEEGNVWLDPQKTSTYKFYQFWLNVSDEDAEKYIKIFSLLSKAEIEGLQKEHKLSPHLRILQKRLAKEITVLVHSEEDYNSAAEASEILFGKGTAESLSAMNEDLFLSVFEGVPKFEIDQISIGRNITEVLVEDTGIFASKGELRRMAQGGGLLINKERVDNELRIISRKDFLNDKYILIQKGKKNFFLIKLK